MSEQRIVGSEPPEEARWALALAGIGRLEQKLNQMVELQREQQQQINDLRNAYTRVAPMATVIQVEQRTNDQLSALNLRVTSLESGTMAAVVARLDADAAQRVARQAKTDRAGFWRTVLLALVLIGLVAVAGLELWVVLR